MATIYQRGDSWYIQWSESGHLRRKSLGKIDKESAKTILHAKEIELRTGEQVLQQNILFKPFAINYLDWHKFEYPDSHDRIYQIIHQYLIPAFEFQSLHSLPIPDIERYKQKRLSSAAVGTVNKELRTLQAVLNKAAEWGYIARNPIKSVKQVRNLNSKPHRYYTKDELKKIYEVDPLHADIWRLMANTGLRRSEALALKCTEVLEDKIRILSTSRDRTKSGRYREIPLSPGGKASVRALQKSTEQVYLVPRMIPRSLTRAFDKALDRAGLDGSLHCLRHTFCSHLVMAGVPLRTVQVLAGHSSFKTTEGYAHLAPDHLQSSVAKLDL